MRHLLLSFAVVVVLAPNQAWATSCAITPTIELFDPMVGCPIDIYEAFSTDPYIEVRRAGVLEEVTTTVETTATTLDVSFPKLDCEGIVVETNVVPQPFNKLRVSIEGALAGDELYVHGALVGHFIAASTPCAETPVPTPTCTVPALCDEDGNEIEGDDIAGDDSGGCSTSGNSCGGALALALLALVRRRRRA